MLLQSVDDRAAVWIATHRVAPLNDLFVWLGYLDKVGAVWVVLALVVGLILRLGVIPTATLTLLTGAATFAADSASFGLKDLVERTRPFVAHPQSTRFMSSTPARFRPDTRRQPSPAPHFSPTSRRGGCRGSSSWLPRSCTHVCMSECTTRAMF